MNYVARALEVDESRGFMKALVDAESGQILGARSSASKAARSCPCWRSPCSASSTTPSSKMRIFAHPTLAESLNNLFASLDN